jgi:hypothetical protein
MDRARPNHNLVTVARFATINYHKVRIDKINAAVAGLQLEFTRLLIDRASKRRSVVV